MGRGAESGQGTEGDARHEPEGAPTDWGELRDDGLWYGPPDEVLNELSASERKQFAPIRLAGRLVVEAETYNAETEEHGLLLSWDDFRGVPRQDNRRVLNGIFWVLHCRAPGTTCRSATGPTQFATTAGARSAPRIG